MTASAAKLAINTSMPLAEHLARKKFEGTCRVCRLGGSAFPFQKRLRRGKGGADNHPYGVVRHRTVAIVRFPAFQLQQHPPPVRESQRDRQRVFTRRPSEGITLVAVSGGRPPSCVAHAMIPLTTSTAIELSTHPSTRCHNSTGISIARCCTP
jgi:hypothetical protein